jgi:polysaccharide biosynthesis transport protein
MDEIAQYWLVLKRRWLPAALVFALTTALAVVYTYKQTEIFQAKGQVILKKTNKTSALLSSATSAAGGAIGELEGLAGSTPVNTQAEILKSLTTINGVLAELSDGKYAQRPERKRLLKFIKQSELFVQQLKVSSIKGTDILEVTFQDPSKELARDVVEEPTTRS